MGRKPKLERNKEIYDLRKSNPKLYSLRKLGRIFEMKWTTVRELLINEHKRRLKEGLELSTGDFDGRKGKDI